MIQVNYTFSAHDYTLALVVIEPDKSIEEQTKEIYAAWDEFVEKRGINPPQELGISFEHFLAEKDFQIYNTSEGELQRLMYAWVTTTIPKELLASIKECGEIVTICVNQDKR